MTKARTFSLPQIAEMSGAEYRTLHTWLKRGLLTPTCQEAKGSGTTNVFDWSDALEACVLADLRRSGLTLDALERTAKGLKRLGHRLAGHELLAVNGTVSIIGSADEVLSTARSEGPVLIYDVTRARDALTL